MQVGRGMGRSRIVRQSPATPHREGVSAPPPGVTHASSSPVPGFPIHRDLPHLNESSCALDDGGRRMLHRRMKGGEGKNVLPVQTLEHEGGGMKRMSNSLRGTCAVIACSLALAAGIAP